MNKLLEYVESDEFIRTYGDWRKGESNLLLDDDGRPMILWHGSSRAFDHFDFRHLGENTGKAEYTDHKTGDTLDGDSTNAMFFTNNREAAITYAFLARQQELERSCLLITELRTFVKSEGRPLINRTVVDYKSFYDTAKELSLTGDGDLMEFFVSFCSQSADEMRAKISNTSEKEAAIDTLNGIVARYYEYRRYNERGGISNQLNNYVRQAKYLEYFKENLQRLQNNDKTVKNEFGDFTTHSLSFLRPGGNGYHFFFNDDNKAVVVGGYLYEKKPTLLESLNEHDLEIILFDIKNNLKCCFDKFNKNLKEAGFLDTTHLYPVFIKATNPIEHNYKESSFPDRYRPNEKYSTSYIAARQARKVKEDGNDVVVYKNIRDPFLCDSYGVFSADQIVMLDAKALDLETSPTLDMRKFENHSYTPYGNTDRWRHLQDIAIPEDCKAIDPRQFYNKPNIGVVRIPDTCHFKMSDFSGCSDLKYIVTNKRVFSNADSIEVKFDCIKDKEPDEITKDKNGNIVEIYGEFEYDIDERNCFETSINNVVYVTRYENGCVEKCFMGSNSYGELPDGPFARYNKDGKMMECGEFRMIYGTDDSDGYTISLDENGFDKGLNLNPDLCIITPEEYSKLLQWDLLRQPDGTWNYKRKTGEFFFEEGVDHATDFKDGFAQVMKGNDVFVITDNKEVFTLEQFKELSTSEDQSKGIGR